MGDIDVVMEVEVHDEFLLAGKHLSNDDMDDGNSPASPDDATVLDERFSLDTDVPTQLDMDLDVTMEIYTDGGDRMAEEKEPLGRGVTVDDIFRDSDDDEEEESAAIEASQKVLELVQAFKTASSPARSSTSSDTDSEDSEREAAGGSDDGSDADEEVAKKASKKQSSSDKRFKKGSGGEAQENGVVQSEIEVHYLGCVFVCLSFCLRGSDVYVCS